MGWHYFPTLAWLIGTIGFAYPTPVDFSGKLSRWNIAESSPTILYRVIGDDPYDETYYGGIVDDAALLWSGVSTSFLQIQQAAEGETEQILVKLRSSLTEAPMSAGYSTFDQYTGDDYPVHCTIDILTTLSYLSFSKTVLHELGHCIGLGHSLIPESIMSYSLSATRFELDTDDIAAISRLYPVGGDNPELPPGCSVAHGRGSTLPTWVLLLWPILIALVRLGYRDHRSGPG